MRTERAFARIRRERGWSLDCAAALLWISPAYLRRLERGAAPLSLPLAERMAGTYGVDLNVLTLVGRGVRRECERSDEITKGREDKAPEHSGACSCLSLPIRNETHPQVKNPDHYHEAHSPMRDRAADPYEEQDGEKAADNAHGSSSSGSIGLKELRR